MLSPIDAATLAFAFVAGSMATLVPKVLLRTPCDESCGVDPSAPAAAGSSRALDAPVYAATMVFGASCLGLLVEAGRGYWALARAGGDHSARVAAFARRAGRLLLLPAVLNVAGTVCQLVALVYISAAVLAGLRGAFILFTAGLSAWLRLKDAPQSRAEWGCIAASAAGALLVGAGSELQAAYAPAAGNADGGGEGGGSASAGAASVAVGAAASLVGYALAAGQVALEQLLLDPAARGPPAPPVAPQDKTAPAAPPPPAPLTKWQILGVEGLYGLALCGALMGALQAAYAARGGESALPLDVPSRTLCCLRTTPAVPALSLAYGASSLAFNAALLGLSAAVGPNYRVFVFTARGVLTWAVEVALYYGGGSSSAEYGEGVSPFSALVLGGYVLLVGSGLWRVSLQRAAAGAAPAAAAAAAGKNEAKVPLLLAAASSESEAEEGGGAITAGVEGDLIESTAKR